MSEQREIAELPGDPELPCDGIGENDHPIPAWFNWGFGGSIVFAVLYFGYYTFLSDWSAQAQWRAETALAQEQAKVRRAALPEHNPFRGASAAIAEGGEVFTAICASCHRADAKGLVGPSLVDPYWKYGSGDAELFETVASGRPGGMPGWSAALGNDKIWKALAYLETLPRSPEPGIGAPEYAPAAAAAATGQPTADTARPADAPPAAPAEDP